MTESSNWAAEAEARVLDAALPIAAQRGWTTPTLLAAGRMAGLSEADVELLLPNGPADLAALYSRRCDARALAALAEVDPLALRVRERIRAAVAARLDAALEEPQAERRCVGFLALPQNLGLGARLLWESADGLWRWAGDTATDENHYSKRAILSGMLGGAVAIGLSAGRDDAMAFVDAQIARVMDFERWKAGLKPGEALQRAAGALGRLRYGFRAGAGG